MNLKKMLKDSIGVAMCMHGYNYDIEMPSVLTELVMPSAWSSCPQPN